MKERFDAADAQYRKGNLAEAFEGFRTCAEAGCGRAQFNLGVMFHNGEGVAKDDVEAARWMQCAAELGSCPVGATCAGPGGTVCAALASQGIVRAQCNLGTMYDKGEGVEKNATEAVRWYRRAAEQGDAFGQFMLGDMYRNGEGVAHDEAEAMHWNQLAADQDLAIAYFYLPSETKSGGGGKERYLVMFTPPRKLEELLLKIGLTRRDLLQRLLPTDDYVSEFGQFGLNLPRRKDFEKQGVSKSTLERAMRGTGISFVKAEIIRLELDAAAREENPELCPITLHDMGAVVTKKPPRRRR